MCEQQRYSQQPGWSSVWEDISEGLTKKQHQQSLKNLSNQLKRSKTKSADAVVRSIDRNILAMFELLKYCEFHFFRLFFDEPELRNVALGVDVILVITKLRCQRNTTATTCCLTPVTN